ncbi:flavin reductase family protein [Thiomicrorhabdus sp. 6S3-12]|uniref:flavin reductase family protein n=1 Tax=Thiomicrorhabdus sp. 6S3-12 TaxID=2819681 RepID=UPI001AAC84D4|nr:flavin reductase family protein [Thiomicrorhabdus sp. 6S3-12]MBO1924414.1 flavin reductase family protein [Thiomicrorhabdus sp. 6S3-12]
MDLDFSQLTPTERYHAMTQAIIPRPIAWVLSQNGDRESYNLAPYSFFTAICSNPPLVLFSAGKKTDDAEKGQPKDTARNILENNEFVIHIPTSQQADAVHQSAAITRHGESEVETLGLATIPFTGSQLPRLAECPVALYCKLHRVDEIGKAPQAVIYGEVIAMHIDDKILDAQQRIDPLALDPLSRLGGDYAGLGNLIKAG